MSVIDSLIKAPRGHKLMTKELQKKLPELGATDGGPISERMVYAKYFSPYTGWYWYGMEYDQESGDFFGYVIGKEQELGYFSLAELESMGAVVERDLHFSPRPLKDCYRVDGARLAS